MQIDIKLESYATAIAALAACADLAKTDTLKIKYEAAHKDLRRAFKIALESMGASNE